VLSSVVALRGALLEQLEGQDAKAGVVEQELGKRARSQAGSEDKEDGRDEVSGLPSELVGVGRAGGLVVIMPHGQ
jgi:hypothetical protein